MIFIMGQKLLISFPIFFKNILRQIIAVIENPVYWSNDICVNIRFKPRNRFTSYGHKGTHKKIASSPGITPVTAASAAVIGPARCERTLGPWRPI